MAMKVGFVGLGKMGWPMTVRLLAAGFEVHVFNRSRTPVEALAAKGARPASSTAEVAERADVVLTALPTPEAVEQVYREMMQRARPGQIYADHSTVSVAQSRRCAAMARERGAEFLDAPVSGGPAGAQAGTLTVMVGGDQGAFDRALPVFRAFGKNIKLCGPAGAGQVVKLINQLLVGVHTAAVAEAAVFGAKLGADPRVALLLKDLGLIHDEAKAANVPLLLGAVAEQRFLEARARGMGENDMASLVRLWEEAAGVTVDKPRSGTCRAEIGR